MIQSMTKQTMVPLRKKWNKILYWYGVSLKAQEEIEINSEVQMETLKRRDNPQRRWQGQGDPQRLRTRRQPPILRRKIQREDSVLLEWDGEKEGPWAGAPVLKREPLEISQDHCIPPAALKQGESKKKYPNICLLPLSDPLLVPSIGPEQKLVGRNPGARRWVRTAENGPWVAVWAAGSSAPNRLSLRPNAGWQDQVCASDLISNTSTRKYHLGVFPCLEKLFKYQKAFLFCGFSPSSST